MKKAISVLPKKSGDMRVGIFYNSISNPKKFSNKTMLMDNFQQGVMANGDQAVEFHGTTLPDQELDAGFVLGYTLENNFRKKIIDHLKTNKIARIFVDSNILHYARSQHEWHRYSIDSVYPHDGVYFFGEIDQNKWDKFSSWHGVCLMPWRQHGQHVLIMCQRPHGWNMLGTDQDLWLDQMITQINQQVPDRRIRIRMHPGDGSRSKQIDRLRKLYADRIEISDAENIRQDLYDCWCAVGYNSTPNVVAALEGVPVYLSDPTHSWAAPVAFNDISQIQNPPLPDRSQWIHRIANIHWSNQEVSSGVLWKAMRGYLINQYIKHNSI
jgi:hypothetical protein